MHFVSRAFRCLLAVCFLHLLLVAPTRGEDRENVKVSLNYLQSTVELQEIEQRVLPPTLKTGSRQQEDLPAYYRAANPALQERFQVGRRAFEASGAEPFRSVTLIAGAAGIGKTFIKSEIFSKQYSKESVCKFDIRELYEEWRQAGITEVRPDLYAGDVVLSRMLAQNDLAAKRLTKHLQAQTASFFVIDSLDEIHPDDYLPLLREIEAFALDGQRDFVHVVVLGRHLAFRDYWRERRHARSAAQLNLYVLQAPQFRTTGDLLVSSWNYHCWNNKLTWSSGGEQEPMPLADYERWNRAGYPLNGEFHSVKFSANQSMDARVQGTLAAWAGEHQVVTSMLYNLAGNAMIREISEQYVATSREYDERAVMEAYLAAWLRRETESEGRPSLDSPEHLDLYLHLLEHVATRYLAEGKVDANGFFTIQEDDRVTVEYYGIPLTFAADRILHRSGLKCIDYQDESLRRYRFEPVWYHRLLVERHNERVRQQLAVRAPVGDDS